jgi:vacuolar-type H+-ATPase subunit I/STV1
MKSAKLNESAKISQSSEIDVAGNIRELLVTRASAAIRQADMAGDEIAVNSVAPFLRRVSEASRREIKHLVDALQTLDKKLEADGDRIQRDIEDYTELSKHVMQLATIISENVNSLPTTSSNSYASRPGR